MPNMGVDVNMAAYIEPEEEKKEEFSDNACPYCFREFTDEEMMSGKVQMFLAEGCFHQFHTECFKTYAKKTLLTKLPSGDFA